LLQKMDYFLDLTQRAILKNPVFFPIGA